MNTKEPASKSTPLRSQEEVQQLITARICLGCGLPISPKETPKRGLCVACYSLATRNAKLATNPITFDELESLGLLAPKAKPGVQPGTKRRGLLGDFLRQRAQKDATKIAEEAEKKASKSRRKRGSP